MKLVQNSPRISRAAVLVSGSMTPSLVATDYTQKKGEGQGHCRKKPGRISAAPEVLASNRCVFRLPFLGRQAVMWTSLVLGPQQHRLHDRPWPEYPAANTKQRLQRFARLPGGQNRHGALSHAGARVGWRNPVQSGVFGCRCAGRLLARQPGAGRCRRHPRAQPFLVQPISSP